MALQIISDNLPQRQQEGLETVVGLVAVVMVTYMVLWMRRHSRDLKRDLEQQAGSALATGSSRALVAMAFLAVLREGFETVVFLLATFHASGNATLSWVGALLGIVLAVVLGYGIYKGGVRINLSRFFRITGIVLVVIAAGLVMTAVHTANEAGWINFGQTQAFDLSWLVRPGTPLESFVTGVLGIQPYPVWIEVIAWLAYLVPMLLVMCWPARRRPLRRPHDSSCRDAASDSRRGRPAPRPRRPPHPPTDNQPMKEHLPVAPTSSSHRHARAGITCDRDVPRALGRDVSPAASGSLGGALGWTRASPPWCPMALAAPAGADAKQTTVNINLTPQRLHAQAGQGDDRADPVQRGEQERRRGLRGRAANQGPVPHPRRAGEPDAGPVRRVRTRRAAGALRHQLPRRLPAARHLHRDRQGQGGLRRRRSHS